MAVEKANTSSKARIRRVLILGHKGFIGKHLERHFHNASPKIEVVGVDLPEVDLTHEDSIKKLAGLFGKPEIAVIMLAAVKRQFNDTLQAFTQNLKMSTNLCRLLQDKPVGRFIFFSSSAVYGEDIHNTGITEETPVQPTSYYGMAKFISERLYWKTLRLHKKSSLLILRPPTIYGPGDTGETYGPVKFMNAVARKEEITLWGDGTELREFMFIDDVVDIVHRLTLGSFDGVLNLTSARSYSFHDILNIVEGVTGCKLEVNSRPRTKNKVDNTFFNERLIKEIEPYPFTPLEEGIKVLSEHFSECMSNL